MFGSGSGKLCLPHETSERIFQQLLLCLASGDDHAVLRQAPWLLAAAAAIDCELHRWQILRQAGRLCVLATIRSVMAKVAGTVDYRPAVPRLVKTLENGIASMGGAYLSVGRLAMVQRALLVELCGAMRTCVAGTELASRWMQEAGGLLSESLWAVRGVVEGSVLGKGRGAAAASKQHRTVAGMKPRHLWIGL